MISDTRSVYGYKVPSEWYDIIIGLQENFEATEESLKGIANIINIYGTEGNKVLNDLKNDYNNIINEPDNPEFKRKLNFDLQYFTKQYNELKSFEEEEEEDEDDIKLILEPSNMNEKQISNFIRLHGKEFYEDFKILISTNRFTDEQLNLLHEYHLKSINLKRKIQVIQTKILLSKLSQQFDENLQQIHRITQRIAQKQRIQEQGLSMNIDDEIKQIINIISTLQKLDKDPEIEAIRIHGEEFYNDFKILAYTKQFDKPQIKLLFDLHLGELRHKQFTTYFNQIHLIAQAITRDQAYSTQQIQQIKQIINIMKSLQESVKSLSPAKASSKPNKPNKDFYLKQMQQHNDNENDVGYGKSILFSDDEQFEDGDLTSELNQSIAQYNENNEQRKERAQQRKDRQPKEAKPIDMKFFKAYEDINERNSLSEEQVKQLIRKEKNNALNHGQRRNRDFETISNNMQNAFDNLVIPSSPQEATFYKKNFLDIIINGNFRIKYIPNAATRDLATKYAHNHVDENGVPRYRLLPPNTKDPNGIPITDLNGDKVDDIVLVDKRGVPVIVNGYKLVFASPYKKVWNSIYKTRQARKETPFNAWMDQMFGKSIEKVDWQKGEYILEENPTMTKYRNAYQSIGLGKPRISKRISPNSYWSSLFSKIWKLFWNQLYPDYIGLTKIINYLAVSNAIYISYFENGIKKHIEQQKFGGKIFKYKQWAIYRKSNKGEYNKLRSNELLNFKDRIAGPVIDFETDELKQTDLNQWPPKFLEFIKHLRLIIFGVVLNAQEKEERDQLLQDVFEASSEEIAAAKKQSNDRIAQFVENLYGKGSGYLEYKKEYADKKQEKLQNAMNFDIELAPEG